MLMKELGSFGFNPGLTMGEISLHFSFPELSLLDKSVVSVAEYDVGVSHSSSVLFLTDGVCSF